MSKLSGWYYDLHQDWKSINRLTTVSLHASSYRKGEDNWAYTPNILNRDKDHKQAGNDTGRADGKSGEYDEDGYYYEPICTCVLQEDFQIQVQNQWSDMGDDKAGGFLNSLRTGIAPFAGTISEGIEKMYRSQEQFKAEELSNFQKDLNAAEIEARGMGTIVGQFMMPFVKFLKEKINGVNKDNSTEGQGNLARMLNSAIVVDGSKFSIYQGSNINFSNMGMRFTVIPKWDPETGLFISVNDQLEELYYYFFGEYVPLEKEIFGDNKLRNVITWQRPPGGYQADMAQMDSSQKGSLKLKIGGNYSICNVVVENASLVFSKQMVKNPKITYEKLKGVDQVDSSAWLTPLSCDVNLVLRPCTRYSDTTLRNITQGAGMRREKKEISNKLLENLSHEMRRIASGDSKTPSYIIDPTDDLKAKKEYSAYNWDTDPLTSIQAVDVPDEELESDEVYVNPEEDRTLFINQLHDAGIPDDVIADMVSKIQSEEAIY